MRKTTAAISALCLATVLAACNNCAEIETVSVLIPTYSGEVNLNGSVIEGTLVELNGCLAINDGKKDTLIVAQEQQKPLIDKNCAIRRGISPSIFRYREVGVRIVHRRHQKIAARLNRIGCSAIFQTSKTRNRSSWVSFHLGLLMLCLISWVLLVWGKGRC